jgi:hypothetical protein
MEVEDTECRRGVGYFIRVSVACVLDGWVSGLRKERSCRSGRAGPLRLRGSIELDRVPAKSHLDGTN